MNIPLGQNVTLLVSTHSPSGYLKAPDETPKYFVFEDREAPPFINTNLTSVPLFNALFYASFSTSGVYGFEVNKWYNVVVSGKVDNYVGVDTPLRFYTTQATPDDVSGIASLNRTSILATKAKTDLLSFDGDYVRALASGHAYYADIKYTKDTSQNEYTVGWYRDSSPVNDIQNVFLQVIKRTDGSNQINPTVMSQIGSTAYYKHDENTNLLTNGEAYIVRTSGIIDGANRIWFRVLGRDS